MYSGLKCVSVLFLPTPSTPPLEKLADISVLIILSILLQVESVCDFLCLTQFIPFCHTRSSQFPLLFLVPLDSHFSSWFPLIPTSLLDSHFSSWFLLIPTSVHPDMTFTVDWALKMNYLSVLGSFSFPLLFLVPFHSHFCSLLPLIPTSVLDSRFSAGPPCWSRLSVLTRQHTFQLCFAEKLAAF